MDETAQVRDKSIKPPGVLPQNAQTRVIAGVAILMILVIAFSGSKPKEKPQAPPPGLPVSDPNQARIQEYRERIEEQAKRLQAEQAELLRAKNALGASDQSGLDPRSNESLRGEPPSGGAPTGAPSRGEVPPPYGNYRDFPPQPRERDWRIVDQEKRDYHSRFSSNVAFSAVPDSKEALPGRAPDARSKGATQLSPARRREQIIFEGTVIETVLINRLDGDFSGPVSCMVTNPVYDQALGRVLIPSGSRMLGKANQVQSFGQRRLAIVFHRLILPDGQSVSLEPAPGLNQQGETGLRDKVNNHYLQIFGASLAIGAVAGLAQAGNSRSSVSAEEYYRRGVSDSLAQSSMRVLDKFLNVLPTVTIDAGHRVKVFLTADLEVPVLENEGSQP